MIIQTNNERKKNNYSIILLFPLFFVLNSWNTYYSLVSLPNLFISIGIYGLMSLLIYIVFAFLYKSAYTSLLLTLFTQFFLLFYGALHDMLSLYFPVIAKHSFLSLTFLLLFFLFSILLKRKTEFTLQNIVRKAIVIIAALIIFELGRWVYLSATTLNSNNPVTQSTDKYNTAKPDIYLLIFDEYTSTKALQSYYQFNNSGIDSFLHRSGFYLFPDSKSNYMRTAFSVASILNFDYVNGIKETKHTDTKDVILSYKKIKHNRLFQILEESGYQTINYSNFDIYKNPSKTRQTFRVFNERLIASNTFFGRITTDLGWRIKSQALKNILGTGDSWQTFQDINQRTLASIKTEANRQLQKPKFIYAHLFMPHPPFLYDSAGKLNPETYFSIDKHYNEKYIPLYLSYLQYTNQHLRNIVQLIQEKTNHKAVIILLGDHGYRVRTTQLPDDHYFFNLQAIYFPDKNYANLYPSATPVRRSIAVLRGCCVGPRRRRNCGSTRLCGHG